MTLVWGKLLHSKADIPADIMCHVFEQSQYSKSRKETVSGFSAMSLAALLLLLQPVLLKSGLMAHVAGGDAAASTM